MKWRQALVRLAPEPGERAAWAVTCVVTLWFVIAFSRRIEQADDAFISYRYAVNLAHGHGLVLNPGEYVEGITNLLWTLLIAAFVRVGVHAPSAGQFLSVICGAASLVLLHVYVRRFLPPRLAWFAAASPVVLFASNGFASWMSAGLETPLVLVLTIAALLAFDAGRIWTTAWLCVLAFLCRPEGAILAAALLGLPWFADVSRGPRDWRRMLRISLPALVFAACVLALTLFRLVYYGDVVPNTFHAKVGQIPAIFGWIYLQKFLSDGPLLLLPPALLGVAVAPRLAAPMAFAAGTALYVIYIGGDVFGYGRFLLPILPVLLAAASAGTGWIAQRQRWIGAACMLIMPAVVLTGLYGRVSTPFYYLANDYDWSGYPRLAFPQSGKRALAELHFAGTADTRQGAVTLGRSIRQARPGAHLVASVGIGKLGYYNMDFAILDLVGLADRQIARSNRTLPQTWIIPGHSRTDSPYVLARKPDIILIPGKTALKPGLLPAVADLLTNPGLEQNYIFRTDDGFWVRK